MTVLAYAIDFGTTNSSIAIAYEDRIEVLNVSSNEPAPECLRSMVYLHRNGDRFAGEDAREQYAITGPLRTACHRCSLVEFDDGQAVTDCRQYVTRQGCQDSRLMSGIKSELADIDFRGTHSWARDFTLPELVSVVLRTLKQYADMRSRSRMGRVVLGHPVVFAGAERSDYETRQRAAEARLEEAAEMAGFTEVARLDEPTAAVMANAITDGVVMAVDFGGGTFDVSIVRFEDNEGEVIGLKGAEIGGERFDEALFNAKVAPVLGLDREFRFPNGRVERLPGWFRVRMSSLGGVAFLLSDRDVPLLLNEFERADPETIGRIKALLFGGHAYGLYTEIEQAKVRLSSQESARIRLSRANIEIDIPVERSEFERLIADDLTVVFGEVEAAIAQAGIDSEALNVVVRTGGSSGIPAFVRGLGEIVGMERVVERPAYTTVVHGLGLYAQEVWGNGSV